ncbi:methyltransferase domain-containing protein [Ornithinimicrobium sp. Y1847]|uniref:methyltransferase domain-containing protein n=1 Tax=unclassified Ornithinimicrobium TaxID=2615080 RepID=UPI003B681AA2
MQCDYFDAGVCRSCTLMGVPYAVQLADKGTHLREVLAGQVAESVWLDSFPNTESRFRNRAKLVVAGRKGAPTLGILDEQGRGVDLRHCGLYEPGLAEAVPILAELISGSGLTPYDVPTRQGELKHLLVTHSPDGELMIRFVLRSPGQQRRVEELIPTLHAALPGTRVVSVNLQPEHKAVLEGEQEEVLTEADTLPMRVNDITLHLRTRSFFQTSTAVAAALYSQAREWAVDLNHDPATACGDLSPAKVLDLYCGVGGFALHLAAPGREVFGVEVSPEAVTSARTSAAELLSTGAPDRPEQVSFEIGDAAAYLGPGLTRGSGTIGERGWDLVVVNPPRRGIGPLAATLEASEVERVIYSSCNASTLARDLAQMPSYRVVAARLFDMFPQVHHHEVMVDLRQV